MIHYIGLKIVLDMVPNHSSDEHQWFINSVNRIDPYTDYYVWRDGKSPGVPPTNWVTTSFILLSTKIKINHFK